MSLICNRRILGGLGALTLLGATVGLTMSNTIAQDQRPQMTAPGDRDAAREEVRVGTFQPQAAFERYHRAEDLSRNIQELQQELQEAQQAGDQQRMMELQQRMQQMQGVVIEAFYEDLEKTMPVVAKDASVQIVAVEILYTDPSIREAKDLTPKVIEHLNRGNDKDEQPDAPGQPW